MRKPIFALIMLTLSFAFSAAAQPPNGTRPVAKASVVRFPGVSQFQLEVLLEAKKITAIPLPTWVPEGFKVSDVKVRLGTEVEIQDRVLTIIYAKKLASGKVQRFALEAGFDGLGGLPYDLTKVVSSPVGKIDLMYQPLDIDDSGKKLLDFSMTEWFRVGKTDFHYDGMYGAEEGDTSLAMISLADTEKILKSLQRL